MRGLSLSKLALAALLIIGSAMVAGQVVGWPQRAFIMGVGALFALVAAMPQEEKRKRRAAAAPVQRLSHLADFQTFKVGGQAGLREDNT